MQDNPKTGFLRSTAYALVPLVVLVLVIVTACLAGYLIKSGFHVSYPLHKLISKITQFLLVLSIFPAMVLLKINAAELGFAKGLTFFKQMGQGFALGLVTLLPVIVSLYVFKINVPHSGHAWTAAWLAGKLGIAFVAAVAISFIEEPLFRGILLVGLKKKLPVSVAIAISALFYSTLHFLDANREIPFSRLTVTGVFRLLNEAVENIANPGYFSAIIALFLVGVFLGILRTQVKTSLGLCIGCHSAWVMQIKMNKSLFGLNPHSHYLYLVSAYDGVVGYLVASWLSLALVAYFVYRHFKPASA